MTDISKLNHIVMTVIVHIFMLIGNRKTPVKNLKILFSDALETTHWGKLHMMKNLKTSL